MYFLMYKYVGGRSRLMLRKDLPEEYDVAIIKDGKTAPSHITIPQPNGLQVPIQTHDVKDTTKMLGLNYAPIGNSVGHIKAMVDKGEEWGDKLTMRPLPRQDTWVSFHNQLLPAMTWGLAAVFFAY